MRSVAPFEVGFCVRDLDALLPFYTEVLGFAIYSDLQVPADTSRRTGLSASGYRVVRLETNLGNRFKLAQPTAPTHDAARAAFALHVVGTGYVTFLVDDIRALYAALERAGAAIRSDGIVRVRPGLDLLLATDPEGNFLEFVQYEDLAAYTNAPSAPAAEGFAPRRGGGAVTPSRGADD